MADDKLKTGPESPVLDHPGGGPAGDAQADLKVGHPPGKIGMFQKFTQQPMIEIPIP